MGVFQDYPPAGAYSASEEPKGTSPLRFDTPLSCPFLVAKIREKLVN
jgi:hypothetical protein